jgi:hypothetical protein
MFALARQIKKACEGPPSAQEARPAGRSSPHARVCVDMILL